MTRDELRTAVARRVAREFRKNGVALSGGPDGHNLADAALAAIEEAGWTLQAEPSVWVGPIVNVTKE